LGFNSGRLQAGAGQREPAEADPDRVLPFGRGGQRAREGAGVAVQLQVRHQVP